MRYVYIYLLILSSITNIKSLFVFVKVLTFPSFSREPNRRLMREGEREGERELFLNLENEQRHQEGDQKLEETWSSSDQNGV